MLCLDSMNQMKRSCIVVRRADAMAFFFLSTYPPSAPTLTGTSNHVSYLFPLVLYFILIMASASASPYSRSAYRATSTIGQIRPHLYTNNPMEALQRTCHCRGARNSHSNMSLMVVSVCSTLPDSKQSGGSEADEIQSGRSVRMRPRSGVSVLLSRASLDCNSERM